MFCEDYTARLCRNLNRAKGRLRIEGAMEQSDGGRVDYIRIGGADVLCKRKMVERR